MKGIESGDNQLFCKIKFTLHVNLQKFISLYTYAVYLYLYLRKYRLYLDNKQPLLAHSKKLTPVVQLY